MADLALTFTRHGDFDLAIDDNDLVGDETINTAIIVSLFADRLARDDDKLPDERPGHLSDRRGWFGDLTRDDGRVKPIGSRLWLLAREKELPEVVARAQEYADEALAWLPASGITVEIKAHRAGPGHLKIDVSPGPAEKIRRSNRWSVFVDYANYQIMDILTGGDY